MRILITGAHGMLGRTLNKELKDYHLILTDFPSEDITDLMQINEFIIRTRPDVIINCAAMTAVDNCEKEPEKAYLINSSGAANVAFASQKIGAKLIHISTDYVFSGEGNRPWTEDDETEPQTVYGKSKLAGEDAIRLIIPDNHLILRTAWLYGLGENNFVHTMLSMADGTRPELKVVSDQIGNPTSTWALARMIHEFIRTPYLKGTFHVSCEGECSWCDFAREIFKQAKIEQKVIPCTSAEYPRPARRPKFSTMAKIGLQKAGLPMMPHWKDALVDFFENHYQP